MSDEILRGSVYASTRARPELLEQPRSGEHVWVATVAHLLSDDTAKQVLRDESAVLMDGENIAFVCEEPLTTQLMHRRCTGEPRP